MNLSVSLLSLPLVHTLSPINTSRQTQAPLLTKSASNRTEELLPRVIQTTGCGSLSKYHSCMRLLFRFIHFTEHFVSVPEMSWY